MLIPCLVAAALVAPCFTFPFLWDDFDFLGRSLHLRVGDLLPDPQTIFYRPLSRELYFGILNLLGPSPFIGHLLNAIGLLAIVFLLTSIVSRIAGPRAGLLSGLVFSGLGALPLLTGWVSGVQDTLAMALLLAAIWLELRGRHFVGAIAFVGALLSKETVAVFLPAVLLAGTNPNEPAKVRARRLMTYGLALLAWAAIHPGVRLLLTGGSAGGSGGYFVGPTVGKLQDLRHGFLTLLNLPLGPGSVEDLKRLAPFLALAIVLVCSGYAWVRRTLASALPAANVKWSRVTPILSLMMMLPLLVTGLFIQHWSPYYACMAALGFAPLVGIWLARARSEVAFLLIVAYICLGVWARTATISPDVTTEKNLRTTAIALSSVERGFKGLRSSFPLQSHVYVSTQATGVPGLYHHLYRYQPLRVWYRQPDLFVLDPNRHRAGAHEDFLFWIDSNLNVFEITLPSMAPRTVGPQPDVLGYQKTLRTYALGRAAAGDIDRAVRILISMPGRPPRTEIYDRRVAAAILIASGRVAEAQLLLRELPDLDREKSLGGLFVILAEPIPGLSLDSAAMEAFGIAGNDLEANRMLMGAFDEFGFAESAVRFAHRVLQLAPDDSHATRVLRKRSPSAHVPGVTVPIPHD